MERDGVSAFLAGVDVSTTLLAYVIVDLDDGELFAYGSIPMPRIKTGGNKALRCSAPEVDLLAGALESAAVVVVEQPMGSRVGAVAEVERVVGAVLHALPEGAARYLLGPSEWKRAAGCGSRPKGTPRGIKPEVDAVVLARWPELEGHAQDIRDAACIAIAGLNINRKAFA